MQFRFKDKQRPQGRASQLANSLHDYAFEDVLSGAYLLEEWKPDLITLILDKLVPEEARIFVVGQDFESFCTDEEPWYKTKIKLSKIPEGLIKSWSNPESVCDKLKLPTPNELIASNFDLVERDPDNGEQPTILKDTKLGRVWYRQDDEFQRPKCNLYFSIQSPVAYASPHNINLIRMFVSLFKDHMTEYTYDADLASLFYSIANSQTGLTMSISGNFNYT